MSARMRRKRIRRHEAFARTFGCDCPRHDGLAVDPALERIREEMRPMLDAVQRKGRAA